MQAMNVFMVSRVCCRFDWALTYDVIHDLSKPLQALDQIALSLKPGGLYVMGDLHTPRDR
jgi:hypothetical protein